MALMEIRNLEKSYWSEGIETPVLRGVSFEIGKGEFVAIMGPSGSGKSTLLHVLGFLDRHTRGEYHFEGKGFDDYRPAEIALVRNQKMGFVFQAFNLLPRTTLLENVKLPLLYSAVPEAEWDKMAIRAIESVGLKHRQGFESSQLSGGEKQRVAIARALVTSPSVIFADEPTGNLDSQAGLLVMEYIWKLHALGHTIILVTHETYTASYAERILRLKDGLVEADEKVLNPHHNNDFQK